MSIEESLAALLKDEVEKRVKAVQDAADEAVRAFRLLADQLAQGTLSSAPRLSNQPEILQAIGPTQNVVQAVSNLTIEQPDETPAHMRVQGFAAYQVTNEAATKSNMAV